MPKFWTTESQREFLQEKLAGFLNARANGSIQNYLKAVNSEWFIKWDEHDLLFPDVGGQDLTSEEEKKLQEAVDIRTS
ncbi:hypothetical protein H0H92_014944, partial [Tricholoma furcatifolium]